MVNRDGLIELFLELVRIDSPSRNERAVADFIKSKLQEMGIEAREDAAGEKVQGNTGNIHAVLPATADGFPKLLLSAHIDTVRSNAGVKTVVEGGLIKTDGTTILGADDKAGVAAILEALRVIQEKNLPHGETTIVFTVAEEVGLWGAQHLDDTFFTGLAKASALGYVLDSGGPVGTVIVQAPAEEDYRVEIFGRSAHAGVNPEDGLNAIMIAGKLLTGLPDGRLDEETTTNIGVIRGGEATNIVPDLVVLEGEVRSRQPGKIKDFLERLSRELVEVTSQNGARYKLQTKRIYESFSLTGDDQVVQRVSKAAAEIGISIELKPRGGGSDANIFNARGIPTVNLGIGLNNDHTTEENIEVDNLVQSAQLLVALLQIP